MEKVKMEERYMFGDSFIVPARFDFNALSEYKNIFSIFFCMRNNYNIILFIRLEVSIRASKCCYVKNGIIQADVF